DAGPAGQVGGRMHSTRRATDEMDAAHIAALGAETPRDNLANIINSRRPRGLGGRPIICCDAQPAGASSPCTNIVMERHARALLISCDKCATVEKNNRSLRRFLLRIEDVQHLSWMLSVGYITSNFLPCGVRMQVGKQLH